MNSRALEGDTVRLECKVDASPPPQLFWKKDKDMLRIDPNRMRWVSCRQNTSLTDLQYNNHALYIRASVQQELFIVPWTLKGTILFLWVYTTGQNSHFLFEKHSQQEPFRFSFQSLDSPSKPKTLKSVNRYAMLVTWTSRDLGHCLY